LALRTCDKPVAFALAILKGETLTQTNLLEKNRNPYSEADGVVV
jgi:hypothetical protein